jgi:hypothetical protein
LICDGWRFSRLDELFEASQIFLELLRREALAKLGYCPPCPSSGGRIFQPETYLGPTTIWHLSKVHCTGMLNICSWHGAP